MPVPVPQWAVAGRLGLGCRHLSLAPSPIIAGHPDNNPGPVLWPATPAGAAPRVRMTLNMPDIASAASDPGPARGLD